jgi:hypothetical protein
MCSNDVGNVGNLHNMELIEQCAKEGLKFPVHKYTFGLLSYV